jgi:hypothetical protein
MIDLMAMLENEPLQIGNQISFSLAGYRSVLRARKQLVLGLFTATLS